MKRLTNIFVKADGSLNTYEPPSAVSSEKRFTRLVNLEARKNALVVSFGQIKITDIEQRFNSFSSYSASGSSYLYALSDTGIYQWNTVTNSFDVSPLETFTANINEPWAVVPYVDGLYYTRHGVSLRRIVDSTIDTLSFDGTYEARYAINAHDHLLLANFSTSGEAGMIRWSDINNFIVFDPTPINEADEFTFSYEHGEITGVTVQKDIVNIYLEKAIYQAIYVGYPIKYELRPLHTDLGNKYHHAVISTKDIDFFIGDDNFYMLEGTVVKPIGDKVWSYFKDTASNLSYGSVVRGLVDSDRDRVGWLYVRAYDATYPNGLRKSKEYILWYYYKEERWATEEADFISLYKPRKRLFFATAWDSFTTETWTTIGTTSWDSKTLGAFFLYDGGLYGGEDDSIYTVGTDYDGKILHFQTAEIHLEQPYTVKTLSGVGIHVDVGHSGLYEGFDFLSGARVEVGYRRSNELALTWVSLTSMFRYQANELYFHVNPSTVPVANSYALRFTFTNSDTIFITAITGFTFNFLTPNDANDTK